MDKLNGFLDIFRKPPGSEPVFSSKRISEELSVPCIKFVKFYNPEKEIKIWHTEAEKVGLGLITTDIDVQGHSANFLLLDSTNRGSKELAKAVSKLIKTVNRQTHL